MAPYTNIPLSPAELSYLQTSLSYPQPIRPDGRSPTQFRPLVAETDILPSANGSARICFADGTEAVVGVKVEVEATKSSLGAQGLGSEQNRRDDGDVKDEDGQSASSSRGESAWVEMSIEIPGMRDDDALPVFLAAMLTEALLADGALADRLRINRRFHWRLYIDILLLSQPLSYPLPLLSLTTHLSLLSTRLPALVSEKDEDPLFNDDWEASTPLYPPNAPKPPMTLLVMSIGSNILFDPSKDELAVAEGILAVSCIAAASKESASAALAGGGVSLTAATQQQEKAELKLVALRTIDPPSCLTAAGTPNVTGNTAAAAPATAAVVSLSATEAMRLREKDQGQSVWRPPRGGIRREVVARMIKLVLEKGGVGQEVMDGLAAVES